MAERERRLRLPGKIEQVRAACDFVVQAAEDAGFGDDGVFQSQLAVEEIFTNIVEHGYEHDGEGKTIEIIEAQRFPVSVPQGTHSQFRLQPIPLFKADSFHRRCTPIGVRSELARSSR